jgi:mRNA interferase MazF
MTRTTSSMSCSRNDVVLLPVPFTDLTSRKVRPAIVIGRNGDDLFLFPISSVLPNTDFLINDWRGAGLNVPSGVKAQIATVEARLVVKIVGTLPAADRQTLDERLRNWLQL